MKTKVSVAGVLRSLQRSSRFAAGTSRNESRLARARGIKIWRPKWSTAARTIPIRIWLPVRIGFFLPASWSTMECLDLEL
jgi:hypothetical protein